MRSIHYTQDFPLLIRIVNPGGIPTGVPDFDFDVRLISGVTEFMAGRHDGEFYNCRMLDNERLVIFCDGHGLLPSSGGLIAEISYHKPSASFPDGVETLVRRYDTGLQLTAELVPPPEDATEFTALLPFIKGEKGDKGDDGKPADGPALDFVGFLEFVTDRDTYRVPVVRYPDEAPKESYYYYYSSEFLGIGDWDIDLYCDNEIIQEEYGEDNPLV